MRAERMASAARVLVGALLLTLGVCGCWLLPVPQRPASRIAAPARKPSVLAVILDPASVRDRALARSLVTATARAGERLIVISTASGAVLGSFAAPTPPAMTGPGSPLRLPRGATSFQRARYQRDLAHVHAAVRHDQAVLRIRQRIEVRAWAARAIARAIAAAGGQEVRHDGLAAAIITAVTDIAGLQQTGLELGTRKALAIVGLGGPAASPPQLHAGLQGMTVVVANAPDGGDDAAWQADLLQAGADRALVLTPATDSRLPAVVRDGLDGRAAVVFRLTRFSYGPAQYEPPRSAEPALRKLLRLLTVSYPDASATINGYTDNIAVPGGNRALSWKRAEAVLIWLIDRGVSAGRLQAIGHGAADPVAPNLAGGQPLNRRVVVIVTPGS